MRHVHIHVTGIVQGVGMRPFVYREAMAHGICGWVLNAGDGVHIEAHAPADALDAFVAALSEHAPAAARVEYVEVVDLAANGWDAANEQGFRIVASQDQTAHTTLVSPDIATCDDCLRELFEPADRRYHYPFINCTNCGPRFTIIRSLPYDRAATSMDRFPMCPECAAEYANPLDRRFHAQPDACFDCGPHITWRETVNGNACGNSSATPTVGTTREASDAIIERCVELLASGGIVAIKGLGGFHLACDAANEQAVAELRRRKRRSNKPLAVMVRSLADTERLCHIDDAERDLLAGSIRPIVLLRRRTVSEDNGGSPDILAVLIGAVVHKAFFAEKALSAEGLHVHRHPVAGLHIGHRTAHFFYDAHHLVPYRDAGHRPGHAAVLDVQIAGADTGKGHLYNGVPLVLQHRLWFFHQGKRSL